MNGEKGVMLLAENEVFGLIEGDAAGAGAAAGRTPILIVSDHASDHVPADIDLGIDPALMCTHIAVDIGAAAVARLLAARLGCRAILGGISRLVVDLNREEDAAGLIPESSDGQEIPGNRGFAAPGSAGLEARLARFHRPYHAEVARQIAQLGRPFVLSLHSFTPRLASDPEQQRPWEIGILYNGDDRGARIAIPLLRADGVVGDQQPYSGRLLNHTMNRHVEAAGLPYLGVEMRQDISGTAEGQARMADWLAPVVARCAEMLVGSPE